MLTDRTAVVTGGSSGNGREIARRFAAEGGRHRGRRGTGYASLYLAGDLSEYVTGESLVGGGMTSTQ